MLITIAARKVPLHPSLRNAIRQQLSKRLQNFASAIHSATLQLSDRNGRRGGGDKHCRILLTLVRGRRIAHDEVRASLRLAISRAIDRASNALHRQLRHKPA